jgi:hypothetical protein
MNKSHQKYFYLYINIKMVSIITLHSSSADRLSSKINHLSNFVKY